MVRLYCVLAYFLSGYTDFSWGLYWLPGNKTQGTHQHRLRNSPFKMALRIFLYFFFLQHEHTCQLVSLPPPQTYSNMTPCLPLTSQVVKTLTLKIAASFSWITIVAYLQSYFGVCGLQVFFFCVYTCILMMKTRIEVCEQHSKYILYSLLQYVSAVWGWLSAKQRWNMLNPGRN